MYTEFGMGLLLGPELHEMGLPLGPELRVYWTWNETTLRTTTTCLLDSEWGHP